jgi:hypothetical protein
MGRRSPGRFVTLAGGPGMPVSSSTSCGSDENNHHEFRGGRQNNRVNFAPCDYLRPGCGPPHLTLNHALELHRQGV